MLPPVLNGVKGAHVGESATRGPTTGDGNGVHNFTALPKHSNTQLIPGRSLGLDFQQRSKISQISSVNHLPSTS